MFWKLCLKVKIFWTGEIIGEIKVSETAHQTTSVCFGGPNMDEMYMTSATRTNPVGVDDEGGRLFKVCKADKVWSSWVTYIFDKYSIVMIM